MPGTGAIETLYQQKQALLLESSLNRLKLQAEAQRLRAQLRPVTGLAGKAEAWWPVLTVLAPVAGWVAFRRAGRGKSLAARVAAVAKIAWPAYNWFKRWSGSIRG